MIILSEYGADYLQKTNLNDLAGKFGIIFDKNLIKEKNKSNQNCTSIMHIQDFLNHQVTKNLREMKIGGAFSLNLSKEAKTLLHSNEQSICSEVYNNTAEEWMKQGMKEHIIAAYTEFGQGKVVAMGDIDLFTSNSKFGINSLDNRKFVQNMINWLMNPVKESKVISFLLNQIGDLQYQIRETNKILNNIIETLTILEKRITYLEKKSHLYTEASEQENG